MSRQFGRLREREPSSRVGSFAEPVLAGIMPGDALEWVRCAVTGCRRQRFWRAPTRPPPSCAQFRPGESANPSISLQTGIDAMSLTFGDLVIDSDKAHAQTA